MAILLGLAAAVLYGSRRTPLGGTATPGVEVLHAHAGRHGLERDRRARRGGVVAEAWLGAGLAWRISPPLAIGLGDCLSSTWGWRPARSAWSLRRPGWYHHCGSLSRRGPRGMFRTWRARSARLLARSRSRWPARPRQPARHTGSACDAQRNADVVAGTRPVIACRRRVGRPRLGESLPPTPNAGQSGAAVAVAAGRSGQSGCLVLIAATALRG